MATPEGLGIVAMIDDRSEAGLVSSSLQVKWRLQSAPDWDSVYLSPVVADTFAAVIPTQRSDAIIEYYLQAADSSGRFETLPRGAPTAFYEVIVVPDSSGCCIGDRGNVDGSADDAVSLGDLTVLVDNLFVSIAPLTCWEEGNVDESQPEGEGSVTLGDLTVLIDHLFISLDPLPPCP
ncbi:hypothetical protein GF377_00290 [candidate division GN15 bacterium]|nr:hypothetical protein [candidate division GN15 bacterium]